MRKKIIVVVIVGIVVAALIAFMWWWFFNRPNPVPTKTGSFGVAQNRPGVTPGTGNNNNTSSPTIGNNQSSLDKVTKGKYSLKTQTGAMVGSYFVDRDPNTGSFSITPTDGSSALGGGTYILNIDGVTIGDYIVTPTGNGGSSTLYTFNLSPYGDTANGLGGYTSTSTSNGGGSGLGLGDTGGNGNGTGNGSTTSPNPGGGDWLSVPPIDITPILGTGNGNNPGGFGGGNGGGGNGGGPGGTGGNGGGGNGGGGGTGGVGGVGGSGGNPTGGGTIPPDTGIAPSGLGIGGGLNFSPQSPGTIFSNSNPNNFGLLPNIGKAGSPNGGGLGLGGAIIGAVVTGAAACALPALAQAIGGSFGLAVTGRAVTESGKAAVVGVPTYSLQNSLGETGNAIIGTGQTISENLGLSIQLSNLVQSRVLDCFARTVAHAALEQIARSTVQWINSGFEGSPSFVTNYEQFFTNVADKAAGQFLQGSALSFMCSPFKLQVKIAIAKSYAHSGSGNNGGQCSLTSVVRNVNSFMNGDFSSGGWPGLLSFMGEPTNNPYGAYSMGSIGLSVATANASGRSAFDLSLSGGFLSIKQAKNCTNVQTRPPDSAGKIIEAKPDGSYTYCDNVTVTPGTAIAQTLDHTIGINTESLETAKYFDEIISALVSQLIQNISSKGLLNLSSGGNGYVTTNTDVNSSGAIQQSVLQNIPGLTQSAIALRDYSTQNITSIQASLAQANNLRNCWLNLASASTTPEKAFQARQNVFGVDGIITDLNNRISTYQGKINQSNASINSLQSIGSQAQSTTNVAQLENIMTNLATQVQNQAFTQDTDVVNAQEDQINLGAQLTTINQNIATQLQLCSAGDTGVTQPTVNFSNNATLLNNLINTNSSAGPM